MALNCKLGDLVVVVRVGKHTWALGHIATCVEFIPAESTLFGIPDWVIDPPLVSPQGVRKSGVTDRSLRVIRDQPGTDETLTWAPVPATTTPAKKLEKQQ